MNQNSRKGTPNTGGRRFFGKVSLMKKGQKKAHNFWRFVVVGPFSTEDPKKKTRHTAEQPGQTPPSQFAPQERGAKEEEKKQEQ